MMALIGTLIIPLLIALVIGVATGWWIWAKRKPEAVSRDIIPTTALNKQPLTVQPKIETAAPNNFSAVPAPAPQPDVPASALTALGIPAATGAPDDLLKLKGVGPKLNALLISLGVTRFDQIAAWSSNDIAAVDNHLGSFKGRIVREQWVEQAMLLASGQISAFEAKFGKLDSENA